MSAKSTNGAAPDSPMEVQRAHSPVDRVDETLGAGAGADSPTAALNSRKVSTADIQHVQNLIERCLQLYMPQQEVLATLQAQAKIEPSFTRLVWVKLEEQNPVFFEAYQLRLKIKDQIVMFNYLLQQQLSGLQKLRASWMVHSAPAMLPAAGVLGAATLPMPVSAAAAVAATAGLTKQGLWPAGMAPPLLPQQQQQQQQQQQVPPVPAARSTAGMQAAGAQAAMQQLTMQLQQQPFAANMQPPHQPAAASIGPLPSSWPDFLTSGSSSPSLSAGSLPPGPAGVHFANNQQSPPSPLPLQQQPQQQHTQQQGLLGGGGGGSCSYHAASPGFPKPFSFNDLHGLGLASAMDDDPNHMDHMDYDSDNGGGLGRHGDGDDADEDVLMGGTLLQPAYSF